MMCVRENCRGELRVTHTYTVERQRFQRARCQECGAVHALTAVAQLVAQGRGAKALAAAARRTSQPDQQGPER